MKNDGESAPIANNRGVDVNLFDSVHNPTWMIDIQRGDSLYNTAAMDYSYS